MGPSEPEALVTGALEPGALGPGALDTAEFEPGDFEPGAFEEPPLSGLAAGVCSGLLDFGALPAPGIGALVGGGTQFVQRVLVIVS